jgi:2-methylisocitrate lyase-like PEP mutase family enzyme
MGFEAIYMTGYGTVASHLGVPDAGLASYRDMVERVAVTAGGTTTPLIADADTGYGGLLNVRQTVRGYEAAGASALHIEDQIEPKRCGHTPGTRVIPVEDMVTRLKVALDARRDDDFLIIARTDARSSLGIDEACRRGEAYAKAGADVIFLDALRSDQELETLAQRVDAPVMANLGGLTPMQSAERMRAMGYAFAIFPGAAHSAAVHAIQRIYDVLKRDGSLLGSDVPRFDLAQMHDLVGFPEVWGFEEKWFGSAGAPAPARRAGAGE